MIDLPEVRQLLRDNGLFNESSQRMNRRGQLPSKLRHFTKAEKSDEDTEDDDQYEKQVAALESEDEGNSLGLMIKGTGIRTSHQNVPLNNEATDDIEELIEGKKDYDLEDKSDNFRLKFNRELTRKQKLAHYETPDYCFVARADTVSVLRLELDSLVRRGGVFYSIFPKVSTPEDFTKEDRGTDKMMVVLYFDDAVIDMMGEILKVDCRISQFDCSAKFKCFAADLFDQFDSR